MAQKDAGQALLQEADRLNLAGRFVEAEKLYDQLLTQNHDQPWLLATLGTLYLRMDKYGLAIALLSQAAEKIKSSEVFCNLGLAYKYSGQHEKCLKWFEKSIKNDPTAAALSTYAGLHINVGTPERALEVANRAIGKDPSHSMAHWNRAMALLELGQWDVAWKEMEYGFEAGMRKDRKLGGKPRWDGTPGKKIAVYGEQGLGDEIMFASMLPDLMKDNEVVLECHSRLKTLFEKSFPAVKVYGGRETNMVAWIAAEDIDCQVSLGSLGQYFRTSKEAFPGTPYLTAESAPKGEKFRVGISWTGGLKEGRVRTRSVPLSAWRSILSNDCEFVSLQYTPCDEDLDMMDRLGYSIKRDPAVYAEDYYETAKLVKSCDLVISCCTSVIHLAGALGVPCWVMVPNKPAWRYGVKGPMRWYRSVRLYRQPEGTADWLPVVERIGLDLNDLLDMQKQRAA